MTKKRKKYIPNPKLNPVVQSRKIDELAKKIDKQGNLLDALSKSHDNYIAYLGNFARHDVKNAILSMDSILSVTEPNEFDQEKIDSISMYLKVIRETMDNFSKLVPYSNNRKFTLPILFTAVELLSRADIHKNEIELNLNFDRNSTLELDFPFHSILQIMNNFLINAIKSLESVETRRICIKGLINDEELVISISDNGEEIIAKNKAKIFDFGFSTTGGSGIGLFHAKYLCEELLNGTVSLKSIKDNNYTKTFILSLPL